MNERKKYEKSFHGNSKRPSTVSCGYQRIIRKRTYTDEKQWNSNHRIMKISSCVQPKKDSFDQKNISTRIKNNKQWLNKKKKGGNKSKCKVDFVATEEVMPVISMAAFAQDEVTQLLRTTKEEFLKKILRDKQEQERKFQVITNGTFACQSASPLPLVKGNILKESRDSYNFIDSCNNNCDEMLHVWIHLFYFIINLKINLIKTIKAAGDETLKPNAEAETDILTQAIECVKFFSKLKMKLVAESLEELRFADILKKDEKEIKRNDDCFLSQFLLEMEFLGKKVKEIFSQEKKPYEVAIKKS